MATTAVPPLRRKTTSTVVTETIPTGSHLDAQPEAFYEGDPWEVIGRIHREAERGRIPWENHMARVYRVGEKGDSESVPENNKFMEPFDVDTMRERFGGGRFKVWIYGPPSQSKLVVRPFIVQLDGAPKTDSGNGYRSSSSSNGSEGVAIEAMRMYANPQFMQLQMDVMKQTMITAIEMVRAQMPAMQDPLQTLRNAKEILGIGSPQSPDGGLIAHITLLKELGLLGSPEKKGITEVLDTLNAFKTAGLIPAAAAKADLTATFLSNLPMLVDRAVQGLHEFRLKAEAEEKTMRLSRGEMRPNDPGVITMNPAEAAAPAAAAAASPAPGAPVQVTPEIAQAIINQSHLHRLVMGIKGANSTGQDMYDYLINAWPEILDELAKMTKDTLLAFFKNRQAQMQYFQSDILAEVSDDPRLPKMLEDFLAIAKKNSSPVESVASASVV